MSAEIKKGPDWLKGNPKTSGWELEEEVTASDVISVGKVVHYFNLSISGWFGKKEIVVGSLSPNDTVVLTNFQENELEVEKQGGVQVSKDGVVMKIELSGPNSKVILKAKSGKPGPFEIVNL